MEQLRPRSPLGRSVKGAAAGLFFCLWGWPAVLWAHASAFVLAKCSPAESGEVLLELTVDYRQHPILTGQDAAVGKESNQTACGQKVHHMRAERLAQLCVMLK